MPASTRARNTTLLSTAASTLLAVTLQLAVVQADLPTTTIFTHGEITNCTCIRIPSMVLSNDDTLIAFAMCRQETGDNCQPFHPAKPPAGVGRSLIYKRSTDGELNAWAQWHYAVSSSQFLLPWQHAQHPHAQCAQASSRKQAATVRGCVGGSSWGALTKVPGSDGDPNGGPRAVQYSIAIAESAAPPSSPY